MADRDDLAQLVYDAARANSPLDAFGDDPRLAKYQSIWANAAATALLDAGWVPGELLAAEQARNATLADTIQRVRDWAEATCSKHRTGSPRVSAACAVAEIIDGPLPPLDGPDGQEET